MGSPSPLTERADYGVDAPGVIRKLLVAGGVGLAAWSAKVAGCWSGVVTTPEVGGTVIRFQLAPMGLTLGVVCLGLGGWMFWTSKVGKVRERENLLNRIAWTGSERVLDVGCGRGLMLLGAAKRLTTGQATGIDIWQSEDLSGNRPEATLENARRERVADRVVLETMDVQRLAFADATFDVILSCNALHNIYSAAGRATAIAEIARVLKPGGVALIEDIRHHGEYVAQLARHGCGDPQRIGSRAAAGFFFVLTWGSLSPGAILVRKRA
jgi:SAM-dependent methyltransferase